MRPLGYWAAAGLALSLMVGCAAGNSTSFSMNGDATVDGQGGHGPDGSESDGQSSGKDTGPKHHDSGHDAGHVHDAAAHDSAPDGAECIAPQIQCASGCVSPLQDPANCGSCGHACTAGLVCSSGACTVNCGAGQVKCGGVGTPDAGSHDAAADAHDAGHDSGVPAGDAGAGTNPSGEYCADPTNDRLNCGGCNIICPYGAHSTPTCTASACAITCDQGYADCDNNPANGCEVDVSNNPLSCGSCTNVCPALNATATCTAGVCGLGMCAPGFANCTGSRTGCTTSTNSIANCGGCGLACNLPNASPDCPAGTCTIGSCNAGYADCDHMASDGCEVNVQNDTNNCGGCGAACNQAGHASENCVGGACTIISCAAGFADCDHSAGDGCEVNTGTSVANCGACGAACNLANATDVCNGGACAINSCNAGWGNCDGVVSNGCEDNVLTDVNNCGSCGTKCTVANGTASCVNGTCTVAACNVGFANCDGLESNGCEVNTNTNVNDCGACGHVCALANATPNCAAGACGIATCNAGFGNCNGVVTDGCETNLTNTDLDCGACGNSCVADCVANVTGTACVSSICAITGCTSGNYNLDGTCGDGCECTSSGSSSNCSAPTALNGGAPIAVGNGTTYTGNLVPNGNSVAYLEVSFGGNTNTAYHPLITMTAGAAEFEFDVESTCGTTLTCGAGDGTGGASTGLASWEVVYTAGDPTSYPVTGSHFIAIPPVGNNGTVIIYVYRKNQSLVDCNSYTLTISNG